MAYVQDLGNGKYKVTISLGFDATGKRQKAFKVIKAKDMEKARAKAAVIEHKYKKGEYRRPTKLTFDEIFNRYLSSHQGEKQLSIKTEARYRQMYNLRIKDFFARYKPERITALVIDDFFTELRQAERLDGKEGGLSEQSIKHHWRLLFAVFNWAYIKDIIPKNPMVKAERVYVEAKEPEVYSKAQAEKLFNALESAPLKYKAITYLALDSGVRSGELVGLTEDCIDFEKNLININKSVQYISEIGKSISEEEVLERYPNTPKDLLKRRIVVTPPKTRKSNRTIAISPFVMDLLAEYMHEQKVLRMKLANKWKKTPWVFTGSYGDILNPNMPSKWLNQFLKENELPKLRFHGLRHSCASLLIAMGQDIAAVSKRLGHSDVNTTLRVYVHSSDERDRKSAEKMNNIFKGGEREVQAN